MIGVIPIFVPPIGIMANPNTFPQFCFIILIVLAVFVVPYAIKHILYHNYLWTRVCLRAKKIALTKNGPAVLTVMAMSVLVPYFLCLFFLPGPFFVFVLVILAWAGKTRFRKEN
jgi:hypothetical protein